MAKCVMPEIDSEINSSNESDEIDFKSGIISVNVESVGGVCNSVITYCSLINFAKVCLLHHSTIGVDCSFLF